MEFLHVQMRLNYKKINHFPQVVYQESIKSYEPQTDNSAYYKLLCFTVPCINMFQLWLECSFGVWVGTKSFAGIGDEKYSGYSRSKPKWRAEEKADVWNRHFRRPPGKPDRIH